MCGEQMLIHGKERKFKGSPPRVRGTVIVFIFSFLAHRITPACAGNSPYKLLLPGGAGDHPHVCGEQVPDDTGPSYAEGSPPRVRGTGGPAGGGGRAAGITPACAGNSTFSVPTIARTKDHPRVCGEQGKVKHDDAPDGGSPPRVRGTVSASSEVSPGFRITPACAGNSPQRAAGATAFRDHPRVCGEQWSKDW